MATEISGTAADITYGARPRHARRDLLRTGCRWRGGGPGGTWSFTSVAPSSALLRAGGRGPAVVFGHLSLSARRSRSRSRSRPAGPCAVSPRLRYPSSTRVTVFPNALCCADARDMHLSRACPRHGPDRERDRLPRALAALSDPCVVLRRPSLRGQRAVATAVALLAYPWLRPALFHQLASDALFAAAFTLVALLLARAVELSNCRTLRRAGAGRRNPRPCASGRPRLWSSGWRRSSRQRSPAAPGRPPRPSPCARACHLAPSPGTTLPAETTSRSSVAGPRRTPLRLRRRPDRGSRTAAALRSSRAPSRGVLLNEPCDHAGIDLARSFRRELTRARRPHSARADRT